MDFDITKNVKLIEMLKSQLLAGVSDLYANLAYSKSDISERNDIIADLLIITYLLANKLGLSYNTLDLKAINKLKLGVLEDDNDLHSDIAMLLKHMNRNQKDSF